MTQRSQDRAHKGKRGVAQRKARRTGYALAHAVLPLVTEECGVDQVAPLLFPVSPRLDRAFIHGIHDYRRKHGPQDLVEF